MAKGFELKVVDASGLTDADWTGINKVMRACEVGGFEVFWDEIDKLCDPTRQIKVAGAFFPDLIREALKDELAEHGITHEDLIKKISFLKTWEARMIRLIAFAAHAFVVTTSVQAAPVAPINEPESLITQVVAGCGVGMTRVNGVCVSRHHKRQARRCARWNGSTCAKYY